MKGHSLRHGKSRCKSKPGPHQRSHKKRSVVRADAERHGGKVMRESESFIPQAPTDGRRAS